MPIVCCGHKVYYQVMYRNPHSQRGNFSLCRSFGCFEDIGDAVNYLVRVHRNKPYIGGEFGIVRTSIKDTSKFVPRKF